MSEKIHLIKTYSIYANKMHFATMIFPFISKEIKKGAIIKNVLEKSVTENMDKIIDNVNIKADLKKKIEQLDWKRTDIEKIKETLKDLEELTNKNQNIHIIIFGSNEFIDKINELMDIWTRVNFSNLEEKNIVINLINCYNFYENEDIKNIQNKHDFNLNTLGIEELKKLDELKKAN